MPWLERRRRKDDTDDRRGTGRRGPHDALTPGPDAVGDERDDGFGERLGRVDLVPAPSPPDDAPDTVDDPATVDERDADEPVGDERLDHLPSVDEARAARPDVPVDLGLVDDEEYDRAVRRVVSRALAEDLGHRGDVTSHATVPVSARGRAVLVAREPGVVAGLDVIEEVVRQVDGRIAVELLCEDGDAVETGDVVARLGGPLRTLLTAERTLLNLVCQLSGVATHTAAFADRLEGLDCVVRDTRKTTPGLRALEKNAVIAGGGANHRVGLYDAVLVKDNHVAAAGGVGAAARAALDNSPPDVHVQVEVTSIAEAEEALAEGVVDLLLDNFTPDELGVAVRVVGGRAAIEASGGITLATARAYAAAGADRLAVGALTHSSPALDLALDVEEVGADTPGVDPSSAAAGVPPPASGTATAPPPEPPRAAGTDGVTDGPAAPDEDIVLVLDEPAQEESPSSERDGVDVVEEPGTLDELGEDDELAQFILEEQPNAAEPDDGPRPSVDAPAVDAPAVDATTDATTAEARPPAPEPVDDEAPTATAPATAAARPPTDPPGSADAAVPPPPVGPSPDAPPASPEDAPGIGWVDRDDGDEDAQWGSGPGWG